MMKRLLALSLLLSGCAEDVVIPAESTGPRRPPPMQNQEAEESDIPPPLDFQETAFVESERSRDPFRSYAQVFVDEARGDVTSQREVILDQYAIEQLRLVALVGGIEPPRAMLVDPAGVGHVVKRGQYIGRASVVQPTGGSGAAYEVNWRVDRIRDGDMVLVRDDPTNPEIPSATRVIPLRTDDMSSSATNKEEATGGGLENELRKMQERLAQMAAAEAARKSGQEETQTTAASDKP